MWVWKTNAEFFFFDKFTFSTSKYIAIDGSDSKERTFFVDLCYYNETYYSIYVHISNLFSFFRTISLRYNWKNEHDPIPILNSKQG